MDDYGLIAQTVCAFFRALDESDYAACGALFAANARWYRQGKLVKGVDDLIATLSERPADLRTRHILTNFIAHHQTPERARGSFYMTVYLQHGARDTVLPLAPPAAIAGYRADLVRLDGDWVIELLESDVYFRN